MSDSISIDTARLPLLLQELRLRIPTMPPTHSEMIAPTIPR